MGSSSIVGPWWWDGDFESCVGVFIVEGIDCDDIGDVWGTEQCILRIFVWPKERICWDKIKETWNIPVTKAFMPFLVPGILNACVRLYEKPTKKNKKQN